MSERANCAHCQHELQGWAAVAAGPVCHTDTINCYRLVTVYGHPTPCTCDGRLRSYDRPSIPAEVLQSVRELELQFPIPPPGPKPGEQLQAYWVCDYCMMPVGRKQIADMTDGEHVICTACMRREHDSRGRR